MFVTSGRHSRSAFGEDSSPPLNVGHTKLWLSLTDEISPKPSRLLYFDFEQSHLSKRRVNPLMPLQLPRLTDLPCKGRLCDGLREHIVAVYELNPSDRENLTFGHIAEQAAFLLVVSHYAKAYKAPVGRPGRKMVLDRYDG